MKTMYVLRNQYDVDVEVSDKQFADGMQQNGWKLIETYQAEEQPEPIVPESVKRRLESYKKDNEKNLFDFGKEG